jgi:hypothetical protein
MTTTEVARPFYRDLAQAMHIMSVQSESRVLLEKVLDDLNTLKHKTYSEELRRDINTSIDLLEKHKETFSFHNVRESILQELLDK